MVLLLLIIITEVVDSFFHVFYILFFPPVIRSSPKLCCHPSSEVGRACHHRHCWHTTIPSKPDPEAAPDSVRGPPPLPVSPTVPPRAPESHTLGGASTGRPAGFQLPASDDAAGPLERATDVPVRQLPVALPKPGGAPEPCGPQLAGWLQLPCVLPQAA